MLTPRGWWESRRLPGSGAGPSPDRLVLGSEGILGIISEAWMRIQARPTYRATAGVTFDSWPAGYEAQINSTHRDPIRTGSLYGFGDKTTVKEQLVKPDEWFDYEVIVKGNHIVIKVNGKTTVDFMDEKKTHTKGTFAFQQHHQGSVVKIKSVEVKELTEK